MRFLALSIILASVLDFSIAQGGYTIVPSSVPLATRQAWCESQITQCPLICLQTTTNDVPRANDCNAQQLTYSCICSNGLSPNISQYSLTLPYYICTEWGTQCVAACGNNNECASKCREDHPCGALHPTRVNTTTAASPHSATAKPGESAYNGFANGQGEKSGAAPPPLGLSIVNAFTGAVICSDAAFMGTLIVGGGLWAFAFGL